MSRWVRSAAVVLLFASTATCGGKSEEQAKTFCDQQRKAESGSNCITDKEYDACVQCYEDCGDNCRPASVCPEVFACQ
jgi:hypothetical protein